MKKKHKWIKEDFDKRTINTFAAENLGSEHHNGPKCENCGFEFCKHCFPEGYKTFCGEESLGSNDSNLDSTFISLDKKIRKLYKGGEL